MHIHIEAYVKERGEDPETILRVDWPFIPREGTSVELHGPAFGDPDRSRHGECGSAHFTVKSVRVSDVEEGSTEANVYVLVEPAEWDAGPFLCDLRCTCERPFVDCEDRHHEDGRCDDCRGRISRGTTDLRISGIETHRARAAAAEERERILVHALQDVRRYAGESGQAVIDGALRAWEKLGGR